MGGDSWVMGVERTNEAALGGAPISATNGGALGGAPISVTKFEALRAALERYRVPKDVCDPSEVEAPSDSDSRQVAAIECFCFVRTETTLGPVLANLCPNYRLVI